MEAHSGVVEPTGPQVVDRAAEGASEDVERGLPQVNLANRACDRGELGSDPTRSDDVQSDAGRERICEPQRVGRRVKGESSGRADPGRASRRNDRGIDRRLVRQPRSVAAPQPFDGTRNDFRTEAREVAEPLVRQRADGVVKEVLGQGRAVVGRRALGVPGDDRAGEPRLAELGRRAQARQSGSDDPDAVDVHGNNARAAGLLDADSRRLS